MAVLHTVAVKATNPGGRLHCGQSEELRVNGEFGFLGEYIDGSHQIRKFEKRNRVGGVAFPTTKMPVVIMQPEMMYDDSRMSLKRLSNWDIKPGIAFGCVPLQEGDKLDISIDGLLKNNGQAAVETDLEVGKRFTLENDRHKLSLTGNNGDDTPAGNGDVYFEVIKIKPAHAKQARIAGDFLGEAYELYTLEVKVKRA